MPVSSMKHTIDRKFYFIEHRIVYQIGRFAGYREDLLHTRRRHPITRNIYRQSRSTKHNSGDKGIEEKPTR